MRLLRVIGSMNPSQGGPCQGIRNSVPELEKLGVHNEVVCFDAPDAAYLGTDSFPVHSLGAGKGPWNYSSNLIPWLLDNFARFDAVIIHGLWLYHSHAVKKALDLYKKQTTGGTGKALPKVYVMPHGMLDPYFQKAAGRKLKAIRNWIYWKLVEGKVVNNVDGLLFTCEEELKLARLPFTPYRPKKEINVGYGIATPPVPTNKMHEAFLAKCPELKGQPYLLFLSRIHAKKGVDLLLKAYADLVRQYRSADAKSGPIIVGSGNPDREPDCSHTALPKLVIAGPGLDSPYGEQMLQLVSQTEELKSAILFQGMLTGDAKWGAFYGCEAFVLPSHQENFGIAVVEALACGKPVLISDQVNIWREIKECRAGLVAHDNIDGTFQLLQGWQTMNEEAKKLMARQALLTFKNYFSIGPAAKNLYNAIAALTAS